jgi:hypothetical protein
MASNSRRYSTKLVAQRCQWHRCANHSGVIDTALQPSFFRISSKIIRHTVFFIRESDSAAHGTEVSLTPMWLAQRCHWHRCDMYCTAVPMTPLCKYDTAVTLDLIFEMLWLSLKGISFFRISSWIIRHTVFIRKSDSAAHGTEVSLTPMWLAQRCHWNKHFHRIIVFSNILSFLVDHDEWMSGDVKLSHFQTVLTSKKLGKHKQAQSTHFARTPLASAANWQRFQPQNAEKWPNENLFGRKIYFFKFTQNWPERCRTFWSVEA